ncbi:MAG: flavin reductase [Rickettsiales bacterium]|nr:flavin reductase [Rickettsiales bacterium]
MNQDFCHNFKKTLSKFSTGVTVATSKYNNDHFGVTVNSFTSLSLDPALILFNLGESSHSLDAFIKSDSFNINILSKAQLEIAENFAKPSKDKFNNIKFLEDDHGNAYFENNLALISCNFHSYHKVGDHYIIIGQAFHLDRDEKKEPLLYYNSNFIY